MIRILLLAIVSSALFLSAFRGGSKASYHIGGDTLSLHYAVLLTIVEHDGFTRVDIRNPWDTLKTLHTYLLVSREHPIPAHLPEGTVVPVPLSRSLVYSSVHASLLQTLGRIESIGGVCDLKYIHIPEIQQACTEGQIADCGSSLSPDIERIIRLSPDAVLLSPFENSGGYGRIEQLGIPLVECADYMETSPLGRAEWMRFYGRLYGVEKQADSLFSVVDSCYQVMRQRAAQSSASLSVLSEMKSGSAWYVPGGRSTMGQLYRDACGRYFMADDYHSGSVPLSFETVFDEAADADVWLIKYNRPVDMTYDDLRTEYEGYTSFHAFQHRHVYGCNTNRIPYYEETPFRPDLLLADFVQMLHPDIQLKEGLRYFSPLKER